MTTTTPIHAVRLIPETEDGRTLLLQRAFDDYLGGHWEFVGGGVDTDDEGDLEDFTLALRRETLEEAGLEVIGDLVEVDELQSQFEDGRLLIQKFYRGQVRGSLTLSHEHDAGHFVPFDRLRHFTQPLTEMTERIIKAHF